MPYLTIASVTRSHGSSVALLLLMMHEGIPWNVRKCLIKCHETLCFQAYGQCDLGQKDLHGMDKRIQYVCLQEVID